jgi:hypothetical protein
VNLALDSLNSESMNEPPYSSSPDRWPGSLSSECWPEAVERAIDRFAGIDLATLDESSLLDREDTKFLVPVRCVPGLLERMKERYRVLDVDGRRIARYHTAYLDTGDFALYRAHHAGRSPRHKVRIRTYLDSGERYIEWKRKNSRGRTLKQRQRLFDPFVVGPELLATLGLPPALAAEVLQPAIVVTYSRITLAIEPRERVTVDLDIRFSYGDRAAGHPGLAIVEIKQDRRGTSPLAVVLRELRLPPEPVSKYCLGVVHLVDRVKKNSFKPLLRRIERVAGGVSYDLPSPLAPF